MPTHSGYKWSVTADVESLAWDPHTEHSFVVCYSYLQGPNTPFYLFYKTWF